MFIELAVGWLVGRLVVVVVLVLGSVDEIGRVTEID